jgi:hypothetical protein
MAGELKYLPYEIKPGDTVSEVLFGRQLAPLYGKQHWVERVLKLNRLDQHTTKQLKAGDVIVLPITAQVFREDEIHLIKSAWQRNLELEWMAPKKERFTIFSSYGIRTMDYGESNLAVRVKQLIKAGVAYKKTFTSTERFRQSGKIQIGILTQSNSSFSSDALKVAEFTPSFFTQLELEFYDLQLNYSIGPYLGFEKTSLITFDGKKYQVEKKELGWGGVGIAKRFGQEKISYEIRSSFAVGSSLSATRIEAQAGVMIKNHYFLKGQFSRVVMQLYGQTTMTTTGITAGYKF